MMTLKTKLLIGVLALTFSVIAGVKLYVSIGINAPLNLTTTELLTLKRGESAHGLLADLKQKQWLTDTLAVKLWLKLNPDMAAVKTGTYEVHPGINMKGLLTLLVSGKEKQFDITLVEGMNWREVISLMRSHPNLNSDADFQQQMLAELNPQGQSLEGWLMPETYHFTQGTNSKEIIRRAYQDMQQYLSQAWESREVDLPYENAYEALIMASIIEKETGLASERARIAGVFVNRLQRNMRLQTDPTVIYGIGESFDGDIRRKDLRTLTPYNTYMIKGLPPTPIAMPGKDAIDAALNPLQSEELYFVARGDGSHVFSRTLIEHNAAVRQYQLNK